MKIKINKFNENVKIPTRSHYDDAGLDCYALEDFTLQPMSGNGFNFLTSNNTTLVSLGFGLEIPNGYMATIRPRSSMNVKGIITQIGTIDSGYRGEIKAAFCNLTSRSIEFKAGDKICQIVIEPVVVADLIEDLGEERADGGFGSTGR